jgi:hypothetical protein
VLIVGSQRVADMGQTLDIGKRLELVPMDSHFQDITIGLYLQNLDSGSGFLVHTYSSKEGAQDRIAFVKRAMQVLGGMEVSSEGLLRFPCGSDHILAVRRIFLEACKLGPDGAVASRPLLLLDRKSGLSMVATSLGSGKYHISVDGESDEVVRRIRVVTGGLGKLGEMTAVDGVDDQVGFDCGQAHDALVGLLLLRAPNVRSILREIEQSASRGVLSAPSAQT